MTKSQIEPGFNQGNGVFMEYNKGNVVSYKGKKAKIIGISVKGGNTRYKLRLYDKFNTIVYNIDSKEINK